MVCFLSRFTDLMIRLPSDSQIGPHIIFIKSFSIALILFKAGQRLGYAAAYYMELRGQSRGHPGWSVNLQYQRTQAYTHMPTSLQYISLTVGGIKDLRTVGGNAQNTGRT